MPDRRPRGAGGHLVCLAASIALFTGLAPAAAGSRTAGDLLDLPFEDLLQVEIRSAGKREEQIRDIPASVTILTREDIARYGWITFEELLRNVPGVYLLDNTEDRFIGTRGAVGGGVQLLVNGIPQHLSVQKTISGTEIARLDIPVEAIDRVEIVRGPMSVIYGNNAFQGVINVVTNGIDRSGPRVSASLGSDQSGRLFGRAGQVFDDGFIALNAGAYRTGGLTGAYADMLSPAQLAELSPGGRPDMDGDMDQRLGSLDLSAEWRGWQGTLRLNRRDYGIYAFTPPFDEGTRIQLDTLHGSLGYAHRFSEDLGLRVTGIYSAEHYGGLSAALAWLAESTQSRWGLTMGYRVDGTLPPLDRPRKVLLFQCARELVMNLIKHAKASREEIHLTQREGCLGLQVEDDGIGFAASHAAGGRSAGGYGLKGVCERLALVDGGLTLEDLRPGARVRLWIPMEPESR